MPIREDFGLPEVFVSSKELTQKVSRLAKAGKVRKIGPKLYTTNMVDDPQNIVLRNLWPVVAALFPGAVICYRTAFDGKQSPDGSVFVSGEYDRNVQLPGVTIRQVKAPGPQKGDRSFPGGLFMASRPSAAAIAG